MDSSLIPRPPQVLFSQYQCQNWIEACYLIIYIFFKLGPKTSSFFFWSPFSSHIPNNTRKCKVIWIMKKILCFCVLASLLLWMQTCFLLDFNLISDLNTMCELDFNSVRPCIYNFRVQSWKFRVHIPATLCSISGLQLLPAVFVDTFCDTAWRRITIVTMLN